MYSCDLKKEQEEMRRKVSLYIVPYQWFLSHYIMKGNAYYLRPKQSYICENNVCCQGRRQTAYQHSSSNKANQSWSHSKDTTEWWPGSLVTVTEKQSKNEGPRSVRTYKSKWGSLLERKIFKK